jgi:hypothetical protein
VRTPRSEAALNAAILAIDREGDAHRFLREYVADLEAEGEPHDIAVEIARSTVAWCFAAGMTRERCAMWQRVIHLGHPRPQAAAVA